MAGQGRAGRAIGLLLTALGVGAATINADYLVSTELRRPEREVARHGPAALAPTRFDQRRGTAIAEVAFAAIERESGSREDQLGDLGMGPDQRMRLRTVCSKTSERVLPAVRRAFVPVVSLAAHCGAAR